MKMKCLCLAATLVLTGCAHGYKALTLGHAGLHARGAQVVGSGRYSYRFVLYDPATGAPQANHPYALTPTEDAGIKLPFVSDSKNVYQGVSDDLGRTAVFRLGKKLRDEQWDLRERFGSGPYGETFRLTDPAGGPLQNFPYALVICTNPITHWQGHTYANGKTAYSASQQPVTINVYSGQDEIDMVEAAKSCAQKAQEGK